LIVRPFIHLFCIAHSTFTSTLRFRFDLIQPLAFSFFTCECGNGLGAFNTHLTCYPFGGQHDAIRNVMYALVQESGHIVWREWWYAFMSKV
jgi:hypothetical protein